jgi:hypothetical protein
MIAISALVCWVLSGRWELAFLCNICKELGNTKVHFRTEKLQGRMWGEASDFCDLGCYDDGSCSILEQGDPCYIMIAATIMHNMIMMEYEQDQEDDGCHDYDQDRGKVLREVEYQ